MKQTKKLLIAASLLLVVLTIILILLLLPESSSTNAVSPADTQTFRPSFSNPFSALQVQNGSGEWTLSRNEDGSCSITDIPDELLDTALCSLTADAIAHLTLTRLSEYSGSLADFGLDDPCTALHCTFGTETLSLTVGNEIPGGGSHYVKLSGKEDIYTWNRAQLYLGSPLAFIKKQITPQKPDTFIPKEMTLSGSAQKAPITVQAEEQGGLLTFCLASDQKKPADTAACTEIIDSLFDLTADSILSVNPSESLLEELSLTHPYSCITFSYETQEGQPDMLTLAAGREQNGLIPLMQPGIPVIYQAAASKLPWFTASYQDIASRLALLVQIHDVKKIVIASPSVEKTFLLQEADDTLTVTDESGKHINTKYFQEFYRCLVGIPNEEYTEQQPDTDIQPLLSITYTYRDGRPEDIISLYSGPTLQAFVSVNGETDFLTKEKYANIILDNLMRLDTEEALSPLY